MAPPPRLALSHGEVGARPETAIRGAGDAVGV